MFVHGVTLVHRVGICTNCVAIAESSERICLGGAAA